MNRIQQAAEFLAQMREQKRLVDEIPSDFTPESLEQAYQVADVLVEMLMSQSGASLAGYKVATTNPVAQAQLDVSGPVFGRLLSNVIYDSPATRPAASYNRRIIEPEYGFIMADDAPAGDTPYTRQSIAEKIETILPCVELVDHRFNDWSLVKGIGLAADNAYNGGWVKGAPYSGNWRNLDITGQVVTLRHSDGRVLVGNGSAVLGHPLNVMAWLANELNQRGLMLKKGQYVTTGVTTNILSAEAGDTVIADFGPLGNVQVSYV